MSRKVSCVVCSGSSRHYRDVDGYGYYTCEACDTIHADPALIDGMDQGTGPVGKYEQDYWEQERIAALDRAAGLSLCRAGESILYCRRPVRRFLDLGTGPGFLLGKLHELLDPAAEVFHGVEKFPPPYATKGLNFHHGDINELTDKFDAGVCIEVVEHVTPKMLTKIVAGLAKVSQPNAFWLFNTGMPDYVRNEDPGYLDPLIRGHVVSYSLAAIDLIFSAHGFRTGALPGKTFGFYAEYAPTAEVSFEERIYHPLEENLSLLKRNQLLFHAAFESARSYLYYDGYMSRTQWALALDSELEEARRRIREDD